MVPLFLNQLIYCISEMLLKNKKAGQSTNDALEPQGQADFVLKLAEETK